jgi:carboxyl-terminal processing protease
LIKRRRLFITTLTVLIVAIAVGGWADSRSRAKRASMFRKLELFGTVVERISNYYVDEVDEEELIQKAIDAMLDDLDPHSQFLEANQYDDLMLNTDGKFGGLGIIISVRDNFPTVISPIDGTPASRLDIKAGDKIVQIEGESTQGWKIQQAVARLRGEPGTDVGISVQREGEPEAVDYRITREIIRIESVPYYTMIEGVGYVRVTNFARNTPQELKKALDDLIASGAEGIILDLRWNPGGLLQTARDVSELFLEKDKLIVYTQGRISRHNAKYYSNSSQTYSELPLVVLVNEASASASEIVAGAIQDWDHGVIVGQTTFGKGSVQTIFELSDGQALKLTTARYYTPSGRSIHRDRSKEEESTILAQTQGVGSGEEPVASVEPGDGSETGNGNGADEAEVTQEDTEREVYHTASGRVVYGGGGITPDWALEHVKAPDFVAKVERGDHFFRFISHFAADHDLPETVEAGDPILSSFKTYLGEKEIEFTDGDFNEETLPYICRGLTREIARREEGLTGVYRVSLRGDPEVAEVLQLFRETDTLQEMFAWVEKHQGVQEATASIEETTTRVE